MRHGGAVYSIVILQRSFGLRGKDIRIIAKRFISSSNRIDFSRCEGGLGLDVDEMDVGDSFFCRGIDGSDAECGIDVREA